MTAPRRELTPAQITGSLERTRYNIDALDEGVARLLVVRGIQVIKAGRLRELGVTDPAREAQVISRVRAIAEAQEAASGGTLAGVPALVEELYSGHLIPGFVVLQQAQLEIEAAPTHRQAR